MTTFLVSKTYTAQVLARSLAMGRFPRSLYKEWLDQEGIAYRCLGHSDNRKIHFNQNHIVIDDFEGAFRFRCEFPVAVVVSP